MRITASHRYGQSVLEIYEVVRNEYASKLDRNRRFKFLQDFPSFRDVQSGLYRKRREIIPRDPKAMQDLEVESDWFKYNETEMVVKGDQILEDGRRIILFSSNDHPQ